MRGGMGGFSMSPGMLAAAMPNMEKRQIEGKYVMFPDKVVNDAKDFILTNLLTQKPVQLTSFQRERQAVILVFWDAKNPVSGDILQYLEDMHGFCLYYATQIVGICKDDPNSQIAVSKAKRTDFPLLYDAGGKVAEAYHINAYPTVMVIDPFGKRQEKFRGGCPEQLSTLRLVANMTGYKYLTPDELRQQYLTESHETPKGSE